MKRFVPILLCTLFMQTQVKAQSVDPYATQQHRIPKDSATKRAARQLKMMERQLQLNEDQVVQLQVILIHRDIVMDSLANNASGNRRSDGQARRSVQQDADQKINAVLTADQRTLYEQWKQQQRQKRQKNSSAAPQNNPQ